MEDIVMAPSNSTNNSIHIRPPSAAPQQPQQLQQQQQQQGLVDPQRRGASAAAAAAATRPHKEQNLNCPRCNSTNTKFCYYNNYSLTQPRYFCKTCRRYWTQGGSLRNVPVGGGSRKNKRSSSSSVTNPTSSILPSSTSSSPAALTSGSSLNPSLTHLINISTNTPHNNSKMNIHPHHLHGQDLNLAFPSTASTTPPPSSQDYTSLFQHMELLPNKNANDDQNRNLRSKLADHQLGNVVTSPSSTNSNNANSTPLSALELLRTGMASSGLSSYVPITMSLDSASTTHHQALYAAASGFPNLQEFKPNLMGSSSFLQANTAGDHHQNTLGGVNMGRFQLHHGVDQENSTTTGSTATEGGGGTNARLLFPFGDINSKIPNGSTGSAGNNNVNTAMNEVVDDQSNSKGQTGHPGYWNGILGGGTSW